MSLESFDEQSGNSKAAIIAKGIKVFAQKPYGQINTFDLAKNCGITRDLLVEYLGGKKEFYLYCLDTSLERVFKEDPAQISGDMYSVAVFAIDKKLRLLRWHANELRFIHMASRETHSDVYQEKLVIFNKHSEWSPTSTSEIIAKAARTLSLKNPCSSTVGDALSNYINAVINKFLLQYQGEPESFMSDSDTLRAEISHYVDYMLYNVVKSEADRKIS